MTTPFTTFGGMPEVNSDSHKRKERIPARDEESSVPDVYEAEICPPSKRYRAMTKVSERKRLFSEPGFTEAFKKEIDDAMIAKTEEHKAILSETKRKEDVTMELTKNVLEFDTDVTQRIKCKVDATRSKFAPEYEEFLTEVAGNMLMIQAQRAELIMARVQTLRKLALIEAELEVNHINMTCVLKKEQLYYVTPIFKKEVSPKRVIPIVYHTLGKQLLHEFCAKNKATYEVDVTDDEGPNNGKVYTAEIGVAFPMRSSPLNISFTLKQQTTKKRLINTICFSVLEKCKVWLSDLTVCGDVECNPGPNVLSLLSREDYVRDPRQPWILPQRHPYNLEYKWIDNVRMRNRTKRKQEKTQEELHITPDYSSVPNRINLIRKQKDDKNKRLYRDYRSRHSRLTKSLYTGDMKQDLLQFCNYLDEHGYASGHKEYPSWVLSNVFESWARCGKLVKESRLWDIFCKKGSFVVQSNYTCYYKSRKLLLRAFVACNELPLCYSNMRWALKGVHKQPSNVGLTLKNVVEYQKKFSRRREDWSKAVSQMLSTEKEKTNDGWIGGTLRTVGRKIAEGIADTVMPALNGIYSSMQQAFQSFPKLSTIYLIVRILAICLMVAILGWAIIVTCRSICLGIDSLCPPDIECDDFEKVEVQGFSWAVTKSLASGWVDTLGEKFEAFNKAFSNAEIMKFVKKLGDMSAALKNVEWLLAKIKEMIIWVVNKTSSVVCGSPFFQDARNLQSLTSKITDLMQIVNVTDITSLTDPQKKQFAQAYMDLIEMYPFVFSIDKHLGGLLQSSIAKAQPLFKQCNFYIKTNITRMEPYSIALDGAPGQGKTYLSGHLSKMIYDCMRVKSPDTWLDLFYRGKKELLDTTLKWTDSLVYNRQTEQEFWDNYNEQPICKVDDIGQQLRPAEARAAEFFSLIRMINNDPYPLHMADIIRKDNTVFNSFLVLTTTNMQEKLFKLPGELGIVDPTAYMRRRDLAISVSREEGFVKEGVQSKQYLDGYRLKVSRVNKTTGEKSAPGDVTSYEDLVSLVSSIVDEIIARHHDFTVSQKMDHTGVFAKDTIDGEISSEDSSDEEFTEAPTSTNSSSTLATSTTETDDLSTVQVQMFAVGAAFASMAANVGMSTLRNAVYGLHPTMKLFLKHHFDKDVDTYDQAQLLIQKESIDHPYLRDKDWHHNYIVNGLSSDGSRAKSIFKYHFGFFQYQNKTKNVDEIMGPLKEKYPEVNIHDVDAYIGLTNPIYWNVPKDFYVALFYKHLGQIPLFYDDVAMKDGTNYNYGDYTDLILFETVHERELRASRGKSHTMIIAKTYALVMIALVGLSLVVMSAVLIYKKIDPTRKIDMDFVQTQSSDPRLSKAQKELARLRALPKVDMAKAASQSVDANATSIQHIVNRNTFKLRAETANNNLLSYAVGLEGCIYVVPGHLMMEKPHTLYLSELEGDKEFAYSKFEWQYVRPMNGLSTADLALVYLASTTHVKTITHLLFEQKDSIVNALGCCRRDLVERKEKDGVVKEEWERFEADAPISVCSSDNYRKAHGHAQRVEGIAVITMGTPSVPGDCVKPYIFYNTAMPRKIGLFHIGLLENGKAIAGRLNQEDVMTFKMFLETNLSKAESQILSLTLETEPIILPKHSWIKYEPIYDTEMFGLKPVGKLNKKFCSPSANTLRVSPIGKKTEVCINGVVYEKDPPFPVEMGPAVLRKKDGKDPMTIGLQSCKNRKIIYRGSLQKEDYGGIFNSALRHCRANILPLWQALKGMENHPKGHSIKRSTSAAFYLKIFNKMKREYVDLNEEEYAERTNKEDMVNVSHGVFLHRDVLSLVTIMFKMMKERKVPANWVIAMLKSELRPLDRVEACKTRVFYAGNFAFMLISRMVFGEFVTCLEANWFDTDIAVGCNPYSSAWRWIYEKITKFGPYVFDDDTEKWDQNFIVPEFTTTFPPAYCDYFNIKGDVKIDLIFETLIVDHCLLVYCVIVSNFNNMTVVDEYVFFFILQSSGVDLTTIINSICNSAANRCLVRLLTGKPFDEVATMWTYGDDLMLNCPSISREHLWKLAKLLFNHTRTDPMKKESNNATHISDAYFLMRKFVFKGIMMCPLNIRSINGMIQFTDKPPKGTTWEQQFASNCKVALMEMTRHGREKYEEYLKEINIYLLQYGPSWTIQVSYSEAYTDMLMRALY